jgi:hypothetical protein
MHIFGLSRKKKQNRTGKLQLNIGLKLLVRGFTKTEKIFLVFNSVKMLN